MFPGGNVDEPELPAAAGGGGEWEGRDRRVGGKLDLFTRQLAAATEVWAGHYGGGHRAHGTGCGHCAVFGSLPQPWPPQGRFLNIYLDLLLCDSSKTLQFEIQLYIFQCSTYGIPYIIKLLKTIFESDLPSNCNSTMRVHK